MKISKRVREEAALICAIAASTPDLHGYYATIRTNLGLDANEFWRADALDWLAWSAVVDEAPLAPYGIMDAEAEALLRTGWTP